MSSKTTGDSRWAEELTTTTRAPCATATAWCRPRASAAWPRWFAANCASQPSGVTVRSGRARTPALLTRMCSGPVQAVVKASMVERSVRSRRATRTSSRPGGGADIGGGALTGVGVPDGQGHPRAGGGQRAGGLQPDPGSAAGHDGALTGQVDTGDHLASGRLSIEGGRDAGHCFTPCVVGGRSGAPSQDETAGV